MFPGRKTEPLARNILCSESRESWQHMPSYISKLLWTGGCWVPPTLSHLKWEYLLQFFCPCLTIVYWVCEDWWLVRTHKLFNSGSRGAACGPDWDHEILDVKLTAISGWDFWMSWDGRRCTLCMRRMWVICSPGWTVADCKNSQMSPFLASSLFQCSFAASPIRGSICFFTLWI